MLTAVPGLTFGANGFSAPPEPEILTGVAADIDTAFGGGVNPALNTPQGQLATSETAILGNNYQQQAFLFNGVDPAFASGRMQDAIARIYFISRNGAQATVVEAATCTGLPGVTIPAGALAQASDGNIYVCQQDGVISLGGTVSLPFACQTLGPIACPAGTLNAIYQAIPGWDTINNPSDGVLGNNTETRQEFEARRAASVAGNSFGAIGSIIGAVAQVAGALDFYGYNNATGSPVTVLGVTIAANSIYICVAGGLSSDIANAILSKLSPGAVMTGGTSVTAYDSNPLYTAPIPYTIKFQIPTSLPILFAISILNGPTVPSNAAVLVQNAILSAFVGGDGGTRARIASELLALRYVPPVVALGTWAMPVSFAIGSTNSGAASFTGAISGTNLTTSSVSGTITVGQTVFGTTSAVLPGTTILSQSSGTTGGAGVYVVSASQTVTSESMESVAALASTVQVQANQIPTINAANVVVTLV